MKEVVCFFLKGCEFGVDVSQMKTIANRAEIEPREGAPDFVKGIVTIHGEQIPLVDVDQLLQIPETENARKDKKFAIFQARCGSFAMECDGISEIASVEDTSVRGVPGFFNQKKTTYADCVIQKKNHALVVVIDPDRLLTDSQCTVLKKLIDTIEEERLEAERKRIEEERRRKEEERKKREEEIAKMQEEGTPSGDDGEPETGTAEEEIKDE